IKENFIDSSGKLSFAITDTMGLFHKGTSDDDNDMYLSDLMYGERCDAIVFLAPLAGDTNGIKLKNAYEKVITNFSLDTPIIVINNKADIFLDQERKNQEDIDIDDIDISDEIDTFNINNIMNMIDKEVSNFNVKLVSSQHKKRTGNDIKSYAVYLKRTKDMDKAFVTKYHPQIMAFGIMNTISKYVGESSEKISFHLKNGYTDIEFDFKEKILTNIFSNHLNKPEYRTKVFNPVQTDIENNLNVIPHGQSYYKLKRNIARGQGSVSQIDESRFKNVSSFAIKFPGNLKNLITAEFIWEVIDKALIIEGGVFEDINEAKKKLYDILLDCSNGYQKGYFKQENFTAKLLYDRTLIPAEKFGMTFGSKFQKFLEVVSEDINNIDKDVKKYEEALKDAMIEPLYLIASRSIRYI
ncbi:hypothetical protein, partial [Zhenhengia yiwuensis]|uniref:hypothetical protein n=1 Tax=Zhenhengia yiwuensis TaxID=2763666 RepID=UPI002A7583F2